jgi:hypothetical protein
MIPGITPAGIITGIPSLYCQKIDTTKQLSDTDKRRVTKLWAGFD